jgi:hypothetical protein
MTSGWSQAPQLLAPTAEDRDVESTVLKESEGPFQKIEVMRHAFILPTNGDWVRMVRSGPMPGA